jgi:osmotically-inducible protein OsmY
MLNNSQLQSNVLAELGWEPSVDAGNIGVSVHDGVVTLNGHVDSFWQKFAAENAAARVKGVKAVAEELQVKLPFDVKHGDEEIAKAAIQRLLWDSSLPRDAIKVRVENGQVTLNGTVNWHYQKESAEHAIRYLNGVVSVFNHINIEPTVNASNVAEDITKALHRSWYYDANTIKVKANGGAITLTGEVTTWNARDLAGTTAWSAPGASSVQNDIRVLS